MSELKGLQCPWCEGREFVVDAALRAGDETPVYYVLCLGCSGSGPEKSTEEEAIEAFKAAKAVGDGCPFCGSDEADVLMSDLFDGKEAQVRCRKCRARGPLASASKEYMTTKLAELAWEYGVTE